MATGARQTRADRFDAEGIDAFGAGISQKFLLA
jgi:hypothetical protein